MFPHLNYPKTTKLELTPKINKSLEIFTVQEIPVPVTETE